MKLDKVVSAEREDHFVSLTKVKSGIINLTIEYES